MVLRVGIPVIYISSCMTMKKKDTLAQHDFPGGRQ
jgi:hypothetical protein